MLIITHVYHDFYHVTIIIKECEKHEYCEK
jgi:hypothetical protein